jgi:hypothetical protein
LFQIGAASYELRQRASSVKVRKIDDDLQRHDGGEGNAGHRDPKGRHTKSFELRQAHVRATGFDPASAS